MKMKLAIFTLIVIETVALFSIGACHATSLREGVSPLMSLDDILREDEITIEIKYIRWSDAITPSPTISDIDDRAGVDTKISDHVVARALVGQIEHSLIECRDRRPASDTIDVRLKVMVSGPNGKMLSVMYSDGEYLFDSEMFIIGCLDEKLRLIFSLGDPGLFTYDEYDSKLIEGLRKHEIQ